MAERIASRDRQLILRLVAGIRPYRRMVALGVLNDPDGCDRAFAAGHLQDPA